MKLALLITNIMVVALLLINIIAIFVISKKKPRSEKELASELAHDITKKLNFKLLKGLDARRFIGEEKETKKRVVYDIIFDKGRAYLVLPNGELRDI